MRISLLIIISLILLSCESKNSFIKKAILYKKMQYIHFDSTLKLMHPESDLKKYKVFNNKKDLRTYENYISNFKFKYIKHERLDSNNVVVFLEIYRPNLPKIISKSFVSKNNLKEIIDKKNLPVEKIDSKIRLRKYKNEWRILFPFKEK